MLKHWSWLAAGAFIATGAFGVVVQAKPAHATVKVAPAAKAADADADSEAGLDLTLRTNAAAQPVKTADGSALTTPASHVYLVDFDTGTVLADKAADMKMYPSSMTKMMTLYLVFDGLKQGTLSLTSEFTVGEKTWVSWNNKGSSMFLPINSQVSLEELIRGIAIQSGNDACVVTAEGIAGSEEAFAKLMNEKAKQLGMTNTNFTDSTGWPNADHTTTPHDLALLGAALIRDFPQYYHYLSEREFTYHGIRQFNRNLLLGNPSLKVDGIKTGHTDAAGYGITLSAKDPATQRRLVLVLNGLPSDADRASEGERLLKWGFLNFDDVVLVKAGQSVATAKVFMGEQKDVSLIVATNVLATVPKTKRDAIKITASYKGPLIAPVAKNAEVGKLTLTFADGSTKDVPILAGADVAKLSWFGRIGRSLGL
jgi:D-alanyl-D-alanine carboxypeptidase (penicillin-binding protein 5/6)